MEQHMEKKMYIEKMYIVYFGYFAFVYLLKFVLLYI